MCEHDTQNRKTIVEYCAVEAYTMVEGIYLLSNFTTDLILM